ncbi:hypothetical protein GCM10009555_017600 [Acrocarpospora macrocephala]|uniref:Uncharacterized protein n=1 Tax=Acrocarpospora macrocephala TaxID=150177 RepID=A0A5M3WGK3_9ACTN|nr:hypothetical protein [Acrocarpospora macrocephala]GES07420.1 hypothetical protein Amac_010150 [Acrocarpospora macrocephala]
MARYRTKPTEIDAIQWTGDNLTDVIAFTHCRADPQPDGGLMVMTAAGSLWLRKNDWIVKHGDGQPGQVCPAADFAAIYEPVA